MATYTLRVRRYQPESGEGAYWQAFDVDLDPTLSVLDGLLAARDDHDGSLAVRCSCRAAICGSCGVKINGQSTLACKTKIGEAAAEAARISEASASAARGPEAKPKVSEDRPISDTHMPAAEGEDMGAVIEPAAEGGDTGAVITVEPMGNMPVVKDLIVNMESVHWRKIRRVTPWLEPRGPEPEREYIVDPDAMIDVTQTMACIQCGACVSACLSMEADPDFVGPAALAKAYRFVGDPRDGLTGERLEDLANDPHGIYDCTHCFACVEACPKGVAPMDQIMRLRRRAGHDHGIDDVNNGRRHSTAFAQIIENKGTLDEAQFLQETFAQGIKGKLKPSRSAIVGLISSLPTGFRALRSRKTGSLLKLIPGLHKKLPGDAQPRVKTIYKHAEDHRAELNLYVKGEES